MSAPLHPDVKKRFTAELTKARQELGQLMQVKKADRRMRDIENVKKRIQTLGEWINPEKPKAPVIAELEGIEKEFQEWKKGFREAFLTYVKNTKENKDEGNTLAFKLNSTGEVDVLYDLMFKHLSDKITVTAPKPVITYYQRRVHHEIQRNSRSGLNPFADPGTSKESKSDELHRGDEGVSPDTVPERGLPDGPDQG